MAVEASVPFTYQLTDPFHSQLFGPLLLDPLLHLVLHELFRPETIVS
jgi:hypothetical protein